MARMSQRVMMNRVRQYRVVQAHKRRIRDEIKPQLRAKRRQWKGAVVAHKLRIRAEWVEKRQKARAQMRQQQLKHREIIRAHKLRLRSEMAGR